MNFKNTISHEEQRLFTLLFIYHDNKTKGEGKKNVDKKRLLTHIPDMTRDPIRNMAEEDMDQILDKLAGEGYIKLGSYGAESYYEVLDVGRDFLEENVIPSGKEPILPRYLPEKELTQLLDVLADALRARVTIMDENGKFRIASGRTGWLCETHIQDISITSCICCDILAARRAKKIGVHSYRCHAGLVECIAPIWLNGDQCGYVFLGRIIPDDLDIDRFIQNCKARGALNLDEEKIRSVIEKERKTRDEIEIIENITAEIGILLSAMVRQLDDYSSKINMLDEIIETGAGVLDLDEILRNIMQSAKRVFRYDGAVIWRLEPDLRTLSSLVSESGDPASVTKRCFDIDEESFTSWIARERKPLLITDVFGYVDRNMRPRPKYMNYIKKVELSSFLGVPLIVENKFIGVFEIERHREGQFTELDRNLLVAVGQIVGIAISKSKLLDVLTSISQKHNLTDLLKTAVTEMPALLGAEHCSIFLFDLERRKLFLRASNSPALEGELNKAYYDEERTGLTWRVVKIRKTVMLKYARKSPYWKGRYQEAEPGVYLGCPLKDKSGKVHGVIRFTSRYEGFPFTKRDKKLAEILSTWLSLAIDRIHLASARKNSELLLRIAEMQNTASSIDDLLDGVAEKMTRTFSCQACEITLVDRERGDLEIRGVYGDGAERKSARYTAGDGSFTGEVARQRKILRFANIAGFYKPSPVPERPLARGPRLGIPLIHNEELIGVLKLANKSGGSDDPTGEFTQHDDTTGRIIASGIAKTVHDYQERASVSELFREVDRQYVENRDAQLALKYMKENLGKAIGRCWGSLFRYEPGDGVFVRVAFSAIEGALPETTNEGHIPTIVANKTVRYIEDALNSPEHQEILLNDDLPDEFKTYIRTIGSEYVVPLMVVDRLYGVFCFYKAEKNAFTITDLQVARDLAARASLLLESHELLEAQRKLYGASLRLETKLRQEELLREVVESITEIGYDRARIYLTSSDRKTLESTVQIGFKDLKNIRRFENHEIVAELREDAVASQTDTHQEIGNVGLVTHVLELGLPAIYVRKGSESHKTIAQRDTEGIQIYITAGDIHKKRLERESVDEWLDFPLIAAGEKVGKITVDNKWSKRSFSRIDCEILGLFGQYTAQAIRNAREIERIEGFGFGALTLAHKMEGSTSAILLMLDLVQKRTLPDKLDQRIQRIREANDDIIRRIRTTRKAIGIEELKFEPATVRNLKELILNESGVSDPGVVVFGISKKLSNMEIRIDKDLIIGVFENLMGNSEEAIKGVGKVRISARLESNDLYLSWQDDGPGIPEKNVQDLFTMGFTTKEGGTGTGLYSVKRMLSKQGGYIEFDKDRKNKEGNYVARFVMKIPLFTSKPEDHDDTDSSNEGGSRL